MKMIEQSLEGKKWKYTIIGSYTLSGIVSFEGRLYAESKWYTKNSNDQNQTNIVKAIAKKLTKR